MSAATAAPTTPTGTHRAALIATILVAGFIFSLNARGYILESDVVTQAFGLDHYNIQWVTGLEGMAGLASLFAAIYLIKVFGARWVFLLGTGCMAVGALGESFAQTPIEFGVTGILRSCGGFLAIPGLILFQRLMPGHSRFAYCTWLTVVYGGQVIVESAGALVAFNPSWRALFAGIGVCGVALVLLGLCLFPDDRPKQQPEHGFDFAGAGLFLVFFALILFLLYRGDYLGWRVSTPICAAVAGVVGITALFIWRELTASEPFINLGGFAYRTVALTMLASAFWCAALYGVSIQLPDCLFANGYDHWKTGWVILPMGQIVLVVMFLGGFVWHRGALVWLYRIGLAGMTVVGFWLARIDIYTPWQWVMGVSSLWAVFAGLCMSPISQLTFQGQPPPIAGATGAIKFFMRSFSGTVGILLVGVLIDQGAWWGLDFVRDAIVQGQGAVQADMPGIRDYLVRHGSTPAEAASQSEVVLNAWANLHAQVIGYRSGLRFCAWLSAAGLLVTCFISRRKEPSIFDGG
jgi:hypothetical protein